MQPQILATFQYGEAGYHHAPGLKTDPSSLGMGSRNWLPDGLNRLRVFKGLTSAGNGSRLMFQVKDGYGGLDDIGMQEAGGSLFSYVANSLFYVGYGQVSVNGTNISGAVASSTLKILLQRNGSYTDTQSGPYSAGLPQPSAPSVGLRTTPGTGFTGSVNGDVSLKTSRIRSITGGRSLASPTSVVLNATGKTVRLTFGTASSGQDYWAIFVTQEGFGEIGPHYRLLRANRFTGSEFKESDIQRNIDDLTVTNGSDVVTSAGDALFTQADVGKRFAPTSVGYSVPAGTTITEVTSATSIKLSNNVTVSSGSNPRAADVISYVDGIDRAVEIEWTKADLAPETAWIDDYPPPALSHAFAVENIVAGIAYGDGSVDASSTNTGTVIVYSLPNFPESFKPVNNLYLPEKAVAVLGRQTDQYVFVGCRNWIGAVQYVGPSITQSLTLSTVLSDQGIAAPHNWCVTKDSVYMFGSKGEAIRINNLGGIDTTFADKVRGLMKDWEQSDVVVNSHPDGQCVVYSNGYTSMVYDPQSNRWGTPVFLSDFADGNAISAVTSQGKMYITLDDGETRNAYRFDNYDSGTIPATAISGFVNPTKGKRATIHEVVESFTTDISEGNAYVSIHRNSRKPAVSDVEVLASSNIVSSATANWTSDDVGAYLLIFGAGDAGTPLLARIKTVVSSTDIEIAVAQDDLESAAELSALTTVINGHCLIAARIYVRELFRSGDHEFLPKKTWTRSCSSFALGITLLTEAGNAQPMEATVWGTIQGERAGNTRK